MHLKSLRDKSDTGIIFSDRNSCPDPKILKEALGKSHDGWETIINYTLSSRKGTELGWNYSGEKYGWSIRIKDKKRVIVYLLPRANFFIFSILLGEKSANIALNSNICSEFKDIINSAKVYAEGRGIRINVFDDKHISGLKTLIDVK